MGQRVSTRGQGVSEIGGVEIHADLPRPCPFNPALEVLGLERIAFDPPAPGFCVTRMKVQTMRSGQKRQGLLQIHAKFIRCAGSARIVAGDRQASSNLLAGVLEPPDVVALPAMQ